MGWTFAGHGADTVGIHEARSAAGEVHPVHRSPAPTTLAPTPSGAMAPRSRPAVARPPSPRIAGVATALPPNVVAQSDARAFIERLFGNELGREAGPLLAVFDNSGIETRHACMPLEWYAEPHDFKESNARYVEQAERLAREAALEALDRAGFTPRDVTHLLFVSSTGIATPGIDARLAGSLGFASDVRRVPIWGLGCAGGASGLARAAEFARADPNAVVLLIALELCTLAFQRRETDARSIVASALFSDGAAACVVTGTAHAARPAGPGASVALEITAAGSHLWPDTLDIMGWTVDGDGLHVVFSRDIPTFVRRQVRDDLDRFLASRRLTRADVTHYVAHPGGPKVLDAYARAFEIEPARLDRARDVLRRCGNMSSPTCLFVLESAIADFAAGDRALVLALGPGFASEYVVLEARGA
jgi:alkylresorcinol/alkylpyrone synthase